MKLQQRKPVINLNYLRKLSKSNPAMMEAIIEAYLEETPQIISSMKRGIDNYDWEALRIGAHSIRPSFSMMGINKKYEGYTKEIQETAAHLIATNPKEQAKEEKAVVLAGLFLEIEMVCTQACEELRQELLILKTS